MAEVLREFLSAAEVVALRAHAETTIEGWRPGRQGTGYDILPLRAIVDRDAPLVARGLAYIGLPYEDYWDAYLLRYRDGAYVPPHIDPAEHGKVHRRINALISQAERGGELRIAAVPITLAVGDAVLFSPSGEEHEVSAVHGTRLLFSVGAWV